MVFCNSQLIKLKKAFRSVTILILIDGFLQCRFNSYLKVSSTCHNPYFNRWFSAIELANCNLNMVKSHNPYFNRWFSAIYSI